MVLARTERPNQLPPGSRRLAGIALRTAAGGSGRRPLTPAPHQPIGARGAGGHRLAALSGARYGASPDNGVRSWHGGLNAVPVEIMRCC